MTRRGLVTGLDSDRGTAIVETAVAIPALVVITAFVVWVASLGATYVRALDAAQTAARHAARGASVVELPAGMDLQITPMGDLVRAEIAVPASPPIPVLESLRVTVRAEATAAYELPMAPGPDGPP